MAPKSTQHKFYADAWQAALKPLLPLPYAPSFLLLSVTPSLLPPFLPPSTSPAQRHQV